MKSSAMGRLCNGDEVLALDETEPGRELAYPRPPLGPGDGAERERAGEVGRPLDRDDRRTVDPLAELARVDLDEGRERRTGRQELAGERLAGRAGSPDDRGASTGEQRPAQEVHLAAAERVERVRRLDARQPPRVVAPEVDEALDVAEATAALPDPEDEVVVLRPAAVAVRDGPGPGGPAG